jgi:AcrR family transcriptional regulator
MAADPDARQRPYHHGALREALLVDAERNLREHGADQLSLRELARQAGVSHAAPRRHFPDRQALLDALAENGYRRLTDELQAAMDEAGDEYAARLHGAARAYVEFAMRDGALLDLMFSVKRDDAPERLHEAACRLFAVVGELFAEGEREGRLPGGDPDRMRMLLVATLQGIAALFVSGRAGRDEVLALVSDAVGLFTRRTPM